MTRDIASMTNHAFFSDILYRAVMADTITNAKCREACMRLWINYPPQIHTSPKGQNEHSNHATGAVGHRKIHKPAQP